MSIYNFNTFYDNIKHIHGNDIDSYYALNTLYILNADAVHYNYSKIFDVNKQFIFEDERGLKYFYIFDLPDISDIATNIYTNYNNVSININNNGVLIPITSINIINTLLIYYNKISLIIKFIDNNIPDKLTLYFTGILLKKYCRILFIDYIKNKCNGNTLTWDDNCLILR